MTLSGPDPDPDAPADRARGPGRSAGPAEPVVEGGFSVVSAMWVMAVTLVMVTGFANLLLHRYAQAVIRQATDEGARAWAVNGGTEAECYTAIADVLDDLLGGTMATGSSFACADSGETITVTATVTLAALPPMPDATFTTASVVTKELEEGLVAP